MYTHKPYFKAYSVHLIRSSGIIDFSQKEMECCWVMCLLIFVLTIKEKYNRREEKV